MLLGPSVKQSSGIPPHHCLSSAALPGRQFQYSVETSDASNTSQEDSYSRGLLTTVSITALFHLNSAHLFTSNIKLRSPEHSKMLFCLNQASYALWSICPKLRVGLSEPNLGHSWWLSTFPSIYIYIPFFSSFSFFLVTLCGLRNCSSPTRDGAQGSHSESTSPEPWTLMEFPAFIFLSLSLYQCSFIYLQHFSLLFLHLSSISLWPALTPLGTFQFAGPLGQQKIPAMLVHGGGEGKKLLMQTQLLITNILSHREKVIPEIYIG